jgi:hypothetical protein
VAGDPIKCQTIRSDASWVPLGRAKRQGVLGVMSAAPTQPSLDILHLRSWIRENSVLAYNVSRNAATSPDYAFIPGNVVEEYFRNQSHGNYQRTKALLVDTFGAGYRNNPKTIGQNCPRVFCILVSLGKQRYIAQFERSERLWDKSLPFDPRAPPESFPRDPDDPDFYKNFVREQWRFCAYTFSGNPNAVVEDGARILPFTWMDCPKSGGSSTVWRARIHVAYDNFDHDQIKRLKPDFYAVKSYKRAAAQANYERETQAFEQLTRSGLIQKDGIIEFYGGFQYNGTFNVVLEYAVGGTLNEYLHEKQTPGSVLEAIAFWSSLFNLLLALWRIHGHHYDSQDAEHGILLRG